METDDDQIFASSIDAKLPTVSPLSAKCWIFRVPEVLRRDNEKVYEPDIVAIGPYHRKKQSLQPMEGVKKWYLKTLLLRTNMSMLNLIEGIKEFESRAPECYQEPIDVDDDKNKFMEMMIIDGCFLIELFRKDFYLNLRSPDDPIFSMTCMHQYLEHDLLLLENQLPWFILLKLFHLTRTNDQSYRSLAELVLEFFDIGPFTASWNESRSQRDKETLHILDLLRDELVSSYDDTGQTESSTTPERVEELMIPCVTRLLEAGVKFTQGTGSIMNINFKDGNFEIPQLLFHETTEPLFRNVIAFEQCYGDHNTKITSYAVLMDNLINTGKDVEYLVEKKIIGNWLSAEDASKFFNRLYNDTYVPKFYYAKVFKSVNDYHKKTWNRWRANLMRQYLTSPWTIISLIGAIILLVLTFLQTFYTIKQSYF